MRDQLPARDDEQEADGGRSQGGAEGWQGQKRFGVGHQFGDKEGTGDQDQGGQAKKQNADLNYLP